jgi:Ca-activated chloride channel family protein
MKQTCLIWIILALGLVAGVTAELVFGAPTDGAISGRIIESSNGDPIQGALISLMGEGRQATSDRQGKFLLTGLRPGEYAISISASGFESVERHSIVVAAGRTVSVEISLVANEAKTKKEEQSTGKDDYKSSLGKITIDQLQSTAAPRTDSERDKNRPSVAAEKRESYSGDSYNDTRQNPTDYLRQVPIIRGGRSNEEPEYVPYPEDMYFRDYGSNRFIDTRRDHLSTFGLDVDDASFTLARTYLFEGNLPPTDAIRVEEFINHFDYGYNTPDESKFRVFTELANSPFDRRASILKIGIKGREIAESERKPLNLTLVIDVSGSMSYGDRIELLKRSIRMLVEQLDRNDRVGIVAYGSNAFTVLDPISGDRKSQIIRSLDRLQPGGSTYAEAGIRLGYEMANGQYVNGHNNLVVLCSDGVANVGKTDPDDIMRDIKQHVRKGITLSTFGFGMGNYNDVLLERLAINGNGKYAYVDTDDQARKLFVDGLVGTLQVLARDVKVQVDFNSSVVSQYRLIGYENRAIADNKFRDNRQDGGEVGAGHEVTALYEVIFKQGKPSNKLATIFVRWKDADQSEVVELSKDVMPGKGTTRFESARPEFRLAVIASRFAEMLKQTEFSGSTSFDDLSRLAQSVNRQLPNDQTRELVNLIDRAASLSGDDPGYSSRDNSRDYSNDVNYRR